MKLNPALFNGTLFLFLTLILFLNSGCGAKKEIPLANVKLMAAIKTAVSIKSDKQIESCRNSIEQEVQKDGISLHLKEELLSVLQLAEDGKWQQAEEEIREIQQRYIVDASTVQ